MKERPILFNDAMVRAILSGTKTQTRRIIKGAPTNKESYLLGLYRPTMTWGIHRDVEADDGAWKSQCPFGQPGDRLWVRECHMNWWSLNPENPEGPRVFSHVAAYRADGYELEAGEKWIPSIHMLRAACRIVLEIVSVRVERLNEISEEDALAEGITCQKVITGAYYAAGHHEVTGDRYFYEGGSDEGYESAGDAFAELWESVYGAGSWAANQWVWVVEFKVAAL
jgi:hypothetical protein